MGKRGKTFNISMNGDWAAREKNKTKRKKKPQSIYGDGLFGPLKPSVKGLFANRFLVPPFSILNAREGYWQKRKKAWIRLGIESEVGRSEDLLRFSPQCEVFSYKRYEKNEAKKRTRQWEPVEEDPGKGTSIFDPVLCEIVYRWFCKPGGMVLDPFAGGSVRGIVAHLLSRNYYGIELRKIQVEANYQQTKTILGDDGYDPGFPIWMEGDSRKVIDKLEPRFDLIFSCPPYGNLEVYSDDPADLSKMEWGDFVTAHKEIIHKACAKLKNNRFAVWVVGDLRGPDGNYRNLPGETISAFESAGLRLYNDAVLITAVGSLPIRVGKQFTQSRKLGKTHQNVLVFCKGNPRKACKRIPLE